MTLVTCSQIQLFPPLYMIKRFADADRVVIMEEAQYHRHQFFDCFQLTQSDKRPLDIKVPVEGGGGHRPLNELRVQGYAAWRSKVGKTLRHTYGKSRSALIDDLMAWGLPQPTIYEPTLQAVAVASLRWTYKQLGIEDNLLFSTELMRKRHPDPVKWLALLTQAAGGDCYFQGKRAMDDYFVYGPFEELGIETFSQNYTPDPALEIARPSETSVLDTIMRNDPELIARDLLKTGCYEPWPQTRES